MATLYPVIMAGGTGTRLWPLSRQAHPKQFQPLLSEQSMLADTAQRVEAIHGLNVAPTTVICGVAHEDLVRVDFEGADRELRQLVLEPIGRNTAPVAIIAASLISAEDPEGLILLLPADHHVADPASFAEAIRLAAEIAAQGYLTTFGIEPTHPETGYGYICRGKSLKDGAYTVERFVEKPDRATAESYIADGRFTWNAGIFLFRADTLLQEAERAAPKITQATKSALAASLITAGTVHLDKDAFAKVPADSIDYAIMEQTEKAAVVGPVRMGWNDIGSWHAVRAMNDDDAKNGPIIRQDCANTYIRSEGPLVAAIGLDNVVIVATDEAVLVVNADRAQEVKGVIDELKKTGREDLL